MAEHKPPRRLTVAIASGTKIYESDAIEFEGQFWLVSSWLEAPALGYEIPERIVLMETLRYQRAPQNFSCELVLNDPIPTEVLDGIATPEIADKFVVREAPDIRFPLRPKGMH
jgi:hypothetical protein